MWRATEFAIIRSYSDVRTGNCSLPASAARLRCEWRLALFPKLFHISSLLAGAIVVLEDFYHYLTSIFYDTNVFLKL